MLCDSQYNPSMIIFPWVGVAKLSMRLRGLGCEPRQTGVRE